MVDRNHSLADEPRDGTSADGTSASSGGGVTTIAPTINPEDAHSAGGANVLTMAHQVSAGPDQSIEQSSDCSGTLGALKRAVQAVLDAQTGEVNMTLELNDLVRAIGLKKTKPGTYTIVYAALAHKVLSLRYPTMRHAMEMTGTSSRGLAGLRLADIEFVLGELGGQHVLHEIVSNCETQAAMVTASASLLKMAEGTASTESTRNVQSVNATCEWRGAEEMSDARRGITTCIGIMLKHACTPDMEKTIWSNTALDYKVRSIAYLCGKSKE